MVKSEPPTKTKWDDHFVTAVIDRCRTDKGLAARLRRADNPATEYQSWDFLASHGVDLEKDYVRLPFATIAASIAKAKSDSNGGTALGRAIAACYDDGRESSQGKTRLRRLLACTEQKEVCLVLRPLLALICSKTTASLDFARLLGQLRRFSFEDSRDRVKAQWAQEFYGSLGSVAIQTEREVL